MCRRKEKWTWRQGSRNWTEEQRKRGGKKQSRPWGTFGIIPNGRHSCYWSSKRRERMGPKKMVETKMGNSSKLLKDIDPQI